MWQEFRNGNYIYCKARLIELTPVTAEATMAERDEMI